MELLQKEDKEKTEMFKQSTRNEPTILKLVFQKIKWKHKVTLFHINMH